MKISLCKQNINVCKMNIINLLGLIPFFAIMLYYESLIALVIVVNGIVYYGIEPKYRYVDIIFNMLFILWGNTFSTYKYMNILTIIIIFIFCLNCQIYSCYIHLLFVQFPLAFLLYQYYENKDKNTDEQIIRHYDTIKSS